VDEGDEVDQPLDKKMEKFTMERTETKEMSLYRSFYVFFGWGKEMAISPPKVFLKI